MSTRKKTCKASKGSPYQAALEEWYARLRDAYAALDADFRFLHTGKKNFVASFAKDPDFQHARLAPMSLKVFRELHLNKTIAGKPDSDLFCKQVSAVELWLRWPERRTYHGVQCEPDETKQDPSRSTAVARLRSPLVRWRLDANQEPHPRRHLQR